MEQAKTAQPLTVKTENLPLQTALSEDSRRRLGSILLEMTNVIEVRTILTMTVAGLRSWLQRQRAMVPRAATPAEIGAELATLIPHYWTPDLNDFQMRSRAADFYADLEGVSVAGIKAAVIAYRRDPKNEFYPKTGKMRALCADDIQDRKRKLLALDKAEREIETATDANVEPTREGPLRSPAEILAAHGIATEPASRPKDDVIAEIRSGRPESVSDALRQSLERLKAKSSPQDARAMQEKLAERMGAA